LKFVFALKGRGFGFTRAVSASKSMWICPQQSFSAGDPESGITY
jgi:hypothetical protein